MTEAWYGTKRIRYKAVIAISIKRWARHCHTTRLVITNPTKSNIPICCPSERALHIFVLFIRIKALIFRLNSCGYMNT